MNANSVLPIFAVLAIVVSVFEIIYWLISRLGVITFIRKAEVVAIYWTLLTVGLFLSSRVIPDVKLVAAGLVVYALHATFCTSFGFKRPYPRPWSALPPPPPPWFDNLPVINYLPPAPPPTHNCPVNNGLRTPKPQYDEDLPYKQS